MWKNLLKIALDILASAGITYDKWAMGEGTALAYYFDHRESKDIDIFLNDAQYIPLLSPRLNRTVLSADYVEASNYVKMKYQEGEIDFIIAPHLTGEPYSTVELLNRNINLETPVEIVVKKLFYRAETLKTRDVIDAAVVYAHNPEQLLAQAPLLKNRMNALANRWEKIKVIFSLEANQLSIYDTSIIDTSPVIFENLMAAIEKNVRRKPCQ